MSGESINLRIQRSYSLPAERRVRKKAHENGGRYANSKHTRSHSCSESIENVYHRSIIMINANKTSQCPVTTPNDTTSGKEYFDESCDDQQKKDTTIIADLLDPEECESSSYIGFEDGDNSSNNDNNDDDDDENNDDDDDDDEVTEETILQREVVNAEGFAIRIDDDYEIKVECLICFEEVKTIDMTYCVLCDLYICFFCLTSHIETKVLEGIVQVSCPGDSCSREYSDQIMSAFGVQVLPILQKNKLELENNPCKKTCPNCHKIEEVTIQATKRVRCSSCNLIWCFECYAPWHSNVTCKQFQKDIVGPGVKALKYWAKSKGKGASNARKCPKCHFFIERIAGCDHMTCNRCETEFCYKCGGKHRSLGWLGNHYSTYSFLGCKHNLHPKKPLLRLSIRSGVLVGAVIASPVVASVVFGTVVALSPFLLPLYCYKKNCCSS